jgi:alpha-tubulin suppressor-like RCC1 family protein
MKGAPAELSDVKEIACGGAFMMALKNNGKTSCGALTKITSVRHHNQQEATIEQ